MPKPKTPELSDWRVTYLTGGVTPAPVTVRASSLRVRDGAVILEDAYRQPLFAAPVGSAVVRRAEPGEPEEPRGGLASPQVNAPIEPLMPDDPGPIETGPADEKPSPRTRSSRRGK